MSSEQNGQPLSDAELLHRWHGGDKSMGSTLFHRHFSSVQRFFRNKVLADDIEDLVQQTFLGCLEGIARFRGDASFRTYLFAIARRRLYSYLRARDQSRRRTEPDLSVTSVLDLGVTPSSAVAAARDHILMLQAMQRRPARPHVLHTRIPPIAGATVASALEVEVERSAIPGLRCARGIPAP